MQNSQWNLICPAGHHSPYFGTWWDQLFHSQLSAFWAANPDRTLRFLFKWFMKECSQKESEGSKIGQGNKLNNNVVLAGDDLYSDSGLVPLWGKRKQRREIVLPIEKAPIGWEGDYREWFSATHHSREWMPITHVWPPTVSTRIQGPAGSLGWPT